MRHETAEKRAEEAEQRPLEGVEEEEAMTRYQKMRFLVNGPCVFYIFDAREARRGVEPLLIEAQRARPQK